MNDLVDTALRSEFADHDDDESFVERIWTEVESRGVPADRREALSLGQGWRTGGRSLTRLAAVVVACVAIAGGAIAAVTATHDDTAATTDPTAAVIYSSAVQAYALGRTPPVDPITIPRSDLLAQAGVVISDLHEGTSRDGVTPYLAPSTNGGLCALFEHNGGTWGVFCAPASTTGWDDGPRYFDEPDGSYRYVGVEPDGVTSVTAADGTKIPVIDNTYVSRQPIK